jgi:hypothetical protein
MLHKVYILSYYLGDLSTYAKKKYDKTIIPQEQLLKWLC